jgi:hypothetical protein
MLADEECFGRKQKLRTNIINETQIKSTRMMTGYMILMYFDTILTHGLEIIRPCSVQRAVHKYVARC